MRQRTGTTWGDAARCAVPLRRAPMAVILFADDNDILRRVVTRMLEQHGHTVLEACSFGEAVSTLESGTPIDLMIEDVSLPGRADPRLMARSRRRGAALPLIYVSGYPLEEALFRYELRPGAVFLGKPFTVRDLMVAIDTLLGAGPDAPGAA